MTVHDLQLSARPLTQPRAPEKRLFTTAEFLRLAEAGHLGDGRCELIGGEIYDMAADGARTISWNVAIAEWLFGSLAGQPYRIVPDKTLKVDELNAPSPDFWVYPRDMPLSEVTAARALLVIEVSDTTLPFDRDRKAPLYAKGGVRDYWLVDCVAREILVFRLDEEGGRAPPIVVRATESIAALLVPGLELRLDTLDVAAV